jgi:hypothetical protein
VVESIQHKGATPNPRPDLALDWGFLRRTFLATVITTLIVALFATVYLDPAWGGRYLLFGLWSIAFFSLTGLMFKYLLFSPYRVLGLAFAGLKVALLIFPVLILWKMWPLPRIDGSVDRAQAVAMFVGITTPFVVLLLRVIGFFSQAQRKGLLPQIQASSVSSTSNRKPGNGELKSHP